MRFKPLVVFICIPMFIGSIFWAGSFACIYKTKFFLLSATSTTGTVTKFYCPRRGKGSCSVEISYRDQRGEVNSFIASNENPSSGFETGDQVEVLYGPDERHVIRQARLNKFSSLWGWATSLGALGCPFIALGSFLLYDNLRPRPAQVRRKRSKSSPTAAGAPAAGASPAPAARRRAPARRR